MRAFPIHLVTINALVALWHLLSIIHPHPNRNANIGLQKKGSSGNMNAKLYAFISPSIYLKHYHLVSIPYIEAVLFAAKHHRAYCI